MAVCLSSPSEIATAVDAGRERTALAMVICHPVTPTTSAASSESARPIVPLQRAHRANCRETLRVESGRCLPHRVDMESRAVLQFNRGC